MSITLDSITYPNVSNLDSKHNKKHNESDGPPVHGPADIIGSGYGNMGAGIPLAFIIIVLIIIAYFTLFASLGNEIGSNSSGYGSSSSSSSTNNGNNSGIGLFLWGLFVILILLNGLSYIFSIDIIASIKNIFGPVTTIDIKAKEEPAPSGKSTINPRKKQVFHLSDNKYNYEDAKAICTAYDARLATYNELNQAYNEGADWCGYGWSDKQMALFPTQEEKWNKLQTIEGHENDCGRPGINGGFIDNPNVKFGINCYGVKPAITGEEAKQMQNEQLYPKTRKEKMFDKKVDYWRHNLKDVMVSPFNSDNWSVI